MHFFRSVLTYLPCESLFFQTKWLFLYPKYFFCHKNVLLFFSGMKNFIIYFSTNIPTQHVHYRKHCEISIKFTFYTTVRYLEENIIIKIIRNAHQNFASGSYTYKVKLFFSTLPMTKRLRWKYFAIFSDFTPVTGVAQAL